MLENYNEIYKEHFTYIILTIIIILLVGIIFNNTTTINRLNGRINQIESDVQTLASDLQDKTETIEQQNQTITGLEEDIESKEEKIQNQKSRIESLTSQVNYLNSQLTQTEEELEETSNLLDIAQDYQDRVQQGTTLDKAYSLLGDYDKTVNIVSNITGVSTPDTDQELWERGKEIYDWLGNNYDYCSDKGFCIDESSCAQIQFFSPDELLYYGSQDVLCGDCDDKAQLFAGMMYASGVSHDKVRVECGSVPSGGHCWNGIYVNNQWYRIDPVCSDIGTFVLEKFGLDFLLTQTYSSSEYRDVDCFHSYETTSWYNPEGYHET